MKKFLSLLLSLTMMLCAFSGCGNNAASSAAPGSDSTPSDAPSETTAEATPAAAPADAEADSAAEPDSMAEPADGEEGWSYTPISYPLADTPATLDYWITWELSADTMYNDVSEHIALKELEEATGVHLNLLAQSQAAGQTNTNPMIASGDYADMIGMFSYATGMDAAIDDDVVVDLKDMIPEYSPDYYQYLIADDNKLWKSVQTDEGHIGAYVTVGTTPKVVDGTMTFQFMLDELGVKKEDLRTVDQYEDYLTAAKNKYGMAAPLYLPGDFMLDGDTLANTYGVALKVDAITGDLPWIVEDGQVKFGYLEDGFTEYVTLLHDWYEKGLIDSDTASHPTEYRDEDLIGLVANKQVAVFHRGDGLVDMLSGISGEQVMPIYFPTVNADDTLHVGGGVDTVSGETGTVITTGCENLELAMQFMNYCYTDDWVLPSNYGVEGETYDMVDGKPQFEEWTYTTEGRTFSSVLMDYTFLAMVDANVETPGRSEAALSCEDTWNDNIDNQNDYPVGAALTIEEGDQYSRHAGDLVTLVKQYTAKFITGDEPLSGIPEFQQKLIDTGVQDCIDAKQSAYERYMSRG